MYDEDPLLLGAGGAGLAVTGVYSMQLLALAAGCLVVGLLLLRFAAAARRRSRDRA